LKKLLLLLGSNALKVRNRFRYLMFCMGKHKWKFAVPKIMKLKWAWL